MGARQVGKTTMIEHILNNIKNKKIIKISFNNIDIKDLFVNNTDEFIKRYIKGVDILFIDEIHYAKDSGKIFKYIYDLYKNKIKIIITSSSSIDISIQSLKYLVGRVNIFELYSFSFYEFLLAKDKKLADIYKIGDNVGAYFNLIKPYFTDYLLFGGYPRVVLEEDREVKIKLLKDIYYIYALRDIQTISNLADDFKLNKLLKALALQTGNIINYSELSTISNLEYPVLKKIMNLLNKTYICKEIHPFYKNKRTELVKSKKIYFYDIGLRNAIINTFSIEGSDIGFIKENFIFTELIKNSIEPKYWRTNSGAEVDFVIEKGLNIYPLEVKNNFKTSNITKSYLSFIEKYSPKDGFLFTDNLNDNKKYLKTNISFLSFFNLAVFLKKIN
jgi:predicted AAA+ superfamily ATPase